MRNKQQVAIYGAGGFAREVAWLLSAFEDQGIYEVVGYFEDDATKERLLNGKTVSSWEKLRARYPQALVSVAVGDPKIRRMLVEKCSQAGFEFATLVHHSVEMSGSVHLGTGSIVCCGSILTVNIELGYHVHINLDCTIGHDVRIGSFSTLAPGVHVSGNVHIGEGVYIGTGANIINGTTNKPLIIGDGCVVGSGACIIEHAEANALYVGVPAKLKKHYT